MKYIQKSLNTAVIYPCGVCNLNCRYCGIDKNPILKEIDKALEESFKGDYYIERIKKYFPNRGQLKRLETWGGEPFLRMDRIYPLVHQIINHYPYFDNLFSSTNFSYDSWIDQFFGLMDQLKMYPHRDFYYDLQLSCDGPEYINDAGRGKGVTERCLKNYNKLLSEIANGRLGENIHLHIGIKPTLDNETMKHLLDKQKIIEYYQFFEDNFIEPFYNYNFSDNINIGFPIPNTAVPSPVTVEDGKDFAEICRLMREVESENRLFNYFKYYDVITLYDVDITQDILTYKYSHHTCGTGNSMIGFLPDNMLSICHEGFTHFVEEYKKYAATSNRVDTTTITFDKFLSEQTLPFCISDDDYATHMYKMDQYVADNTTARLGNIATEIVALAMAKQVDPCLIDPENALKAAIFIQCHTAYCIKDNYNKTGSFSTIPVGLLKLLLNGAMQHIQHDGELTIDKEKKGECYCANCNGMCGNF